jgi:hypothetical protein
MALVIVSIIAELAALIPRLAALRAMDARAAKA